MFEIEHVVSGQNEVGESPRWDAEEQALYWLDIWDSPAVFRFHPSTKEITRWAPGLPVTGQARREKGGFVFATRKGLYFWDERTGESQFILDPEAGNGPVRFNDGSADRMGRFWAGSTYADDQFRPEGSLYRMNPGLSVQKMAGGLACSNGLGGARTTRPCTSPPSSPTSCWRSTSTRPPGTWPTAAPSPRCRRLTACPTG